MARYIDADALKLDIDLSKGASVLDMALSVLKAVKEAPTADVVPKSEVEQLKRNLEQCENGYRQEMHLLQCKLTNAKSEVEEIFAEIEREINDALQSNYRVLPQIEESEALWNRVNGKIDALRGIDGFVEELKKKYTEEKE